MKFLKYRLDRCTMCGSCMAACSKAWAKKDDPALSRISVKNVTGLPDIKVCNQCGGCIDVCPSMALERDKNGVVQIRRDRCTSCLMCVEFCPSACMFFSPDIPSPFKCVACGICVKACPQDVLSIVEEKEA